VYFLFAPPIHTLVQDGQQMTKIASFVIFTAEHFSKEEIGQKIDPESARKRGGRKIREICIPHFEKKRGREVVFQFLTVEG
jgi:hypothetical protein